MNPAARAPHSEPDAPLADSDEALDPAAMLALSQNQQRSVENQMAAFVPIITAAWGVAWLLGFGALWLIDGLQPAVGLPVPLAVWIFVLLLLGAGGVSAWLGIRSGRGIRASSASAFTGTVYGMTWWVGAVGIAALGAGLSHNGLGPDLAGYFYPSAYVLFAGIMYLVAGAIWRAVPSIVSGAWLVLIASAAPFFPHPAHYLFLAIAGGGAFLVFAVVMFLHIRRSRRLAAGGGGDV